METTTCDYLRGCQPLRQYPLHRSEGSAKAQHIVYSNGMPFCLKRLTEGGAVPRENEKLTTLEASEMTLLGQPVRRRRRQLIGIVTKAGRGRLQTVACGHCRQPETTVGTLTTVAPEFSGPFPEVGMARPLVPDLGHAAAETRT